MNSEETYTKVKDGDGQDYYCPLRAIGDDHRPNQEMLDDCVESEVVQRYSGNLRAERY